MSPLCVFGRNRASVRCGESELHLTPASALRAEAAPGGTPGLVCWFGYFSSPTAASARLLQGLETVLGAGTTEQAGICLSLWVLALSLFFQSDGVHLGVPEHQTGQAAGIGNC